MDAMPRGVLLSPESENKTFEPDAPLSSMQTRLPENRLDKSVALEEEEDMLVEEENGRFKRERDKSNFEHEASEQERRQVATP